jgi:hypothetical protein
MRTTRVATLLVLLGAALAAPVARAGALDGTVKLGGIVMDETGDRSVLQETYNVYDGFALAQLRLQGMPDSRHYLSLDLRDLNLDSRSGDLLLRRPGVFRLTGGFDQHRQIFSPDAAVRSKRRDWRLGAELTPARWLSLSSQLGMQTRDGGRLPFPAGTVSVLGTGYDQTLRTGQVTAEARRDRRGVAVSYRVSDFEDDRNPSADRTGQVVSARLFAPSPFYDKWTHLVRGAYGVRKLSNQDLDYTLANFQYTGVVEPSRPLQLRYRFEANRIDNESTRLKTDRFQNDLDASYFHRHGRLSLGYGYELNDDDRRLTSYHNWRAGAELHQGRRVSARLDYAGRVKKDQEELTLLKDVEASRLRARLQGQPAPDLTLGAEYARREREFPDIEVRAEGEVAGAFGRYERRGWGSLSGDYRYSTDEFDDLAGGFSARSHVVTGRVELDRIKNLRLAGGLAYLDIAGDVDVEKGLFFAEGIYTVRGNYHFEVRYNGYSYDDLVVLDRYYTANVVRINVAYDLHLE